MIRTQKLCKGCGQELRKLQEATMQEDGSVVTGDFTGWFHMNFGRCKETIINETKQNRKKGK